MLYEDLTYAIRAAIFNVHKELSPGLLESVYEAALIHELRLQGLSPKNQVPIEVIYKDVNLNIGFRIDILVNDTVILEIKSVEYLHDVHKKQVLTYLKLSGKKIGFLINYNSKMLVDKDSLIRIVN
jgi:GxxExxY protein